MKNEEEIGVRIFDKFESRDCIHDMRFDIRDRFSFFFSPLLFCLEKLCEGVVGWDEEVEQFLNRAFFEPARDK